MVFTSFFDRIYQEDQEAFEAGMMLNMGQILSIPFILGGVVLILWATRNGHSSS